MPQSLPALPSPPQPDPLVDDARDEAGWPCALDDAAASANWLDAWSALGLVAPAGERDHVESAWRGPGRHYHAIEHLRECLAWWTRWRTLAPHPAEVALAIWYHDAVYDPTARDNEARSAALAVESLRRAGADPAVADRVRALVMATCHEAPALDDDAKLLVDIDLAILGSPARRFARYDADVRREYAWVSDAAYREGRGRVLHGFLDAPTLFHGDEARRLLEARARLNLATALEALQLAAGASGVRAGIGPPDPAR